MRRYSLDHKHERKSRCPVCGHTGRYTRWFDNVLGEYLPEHFGVCDRTNGCGYSLSPYDRTAEDEVRRYERDNRDPFVEARYRLRTKLESKRRPKPSTLPHEWMSESMKRELPDLAAWLTETIGNSEYSDALSRALYMYNVSADRNGRTVFWYVAYDGGVRTAKVMKYMKDGHRDKSVKPYWLHRLLPDGFNLERPLYGEHLVSSAPESMEIAIVESEKTAIVMSVFSNRYVWLATGGGNSLNARMLPKHRRITLFPDTDSEHLEAWKRFAADNGCSVAMSWMRYLTPAQIAAGEDIADLIIRAWTSTR